MLNIKDEDNKCQKESMNMLLCKFYENFFLLGKSMNISWTEYYDLNFKVWVNVVSA